MTWWQGVLAYVIGPMIITAGTVLAARFAGRSADRAAESTTEVEKEANAIDGFDRLARSLERRVGGLVDEVGRLQNRLAELEREVRHLRNERQENRALIRRLWARLQVAIAEIHRLHGNVPPDAHHDEERVTLILEAESSS